jgi:hypothetical protein
MSQQYTYGEFANTEEKCLRYTGACEGNGWGGVTGNFDKQGMSAFIMSWAAGQGKLQPVIKAMFDNGEGVFRSCLTQPVAQNNGEPMDLTALLLQFCALPANEGVEWAKARQDAEGRMQAHWIAAFAALGEVPLYRRIQVHFAQEYMQHAKAYMEHFGFTTERALALLFDICIQEGSITGPSMTRYYEHIHDAMGEHAKLIALAHAVGPQAGMYEGDVEQRKLCAVLGGGRVHGTMYNMAKDFGIGDGPVQYAA